MENLKIRDRIVSFIRTLPSPVSVKAYGSSIAFQGEESAKDKKQVDLVVIVDDIKKFYEKNLKENPYMYKLVPRFYFKHASVKQLKSYASICYTTHINYGIDTYKMGVIEKKDVLDDLLNWKTFYIAGRFQKEMYTPISDADIERANEINKKNALTVALVLLDRKNPTIDKLYEVLCSLSYMGDNRKTLKAEDPNKVKKLAKYSKEFFDREYRDKTVLFTVNDDDSLNINYDMVKKSTYFLPLALRGKILSIYDMELSKEEELEKTREVVKDYLTEIIKASSKGQTKKGILTTGPVNSISYALAKLKKGRRKPARDINDKEVQR